MASSVDYISLGEDAVAATVLQALVTLFVVFATMLSFSLTWRRLFNDKVYVMGAKRELAVSGVSMFMIDLAVIGIAIGLLVVWYNKVGLDWSSQGSGYGVIEIQDARFWLLWGTLLVLTFFALHDWALKVYVTVYYKDGGSIMKPNDFNKPEEVKLEGVAGSRKRISWFRATHVLHLILLVFLVIYPIITLTIFENASGGITLVKAAIIATACVLLFGLLMHIGAREKLDLNTKGAAARLAGTKMTISTNLAVSNQNKLSSMNGETIKIQGHDGLFHKDKEETVILKIAESMFAKHGDKNGLEGKVVRELTDGDRYVYDADVAHNLDELYRHNGSELFKQNISTSLDYKIGVPVFGRYESEYLVMFYHHVAGVGIGVGIWEDLPSWFPWAYFFYFYAAWTQNLRNEMSGVAVTFVACFIAILLSYGGYWGQFFELHRKFLMVGIMVFVSTQFIANPSTESYVISPDVFFDNTTVWQSDTTLTSTTQSFTVQMTTWWAFGLCCLYACFGVAGIFINWCGKDYTFVAGQDEI